MKESKGKGLDARPAIVFATLENLQACDAQIIETYIEKLEMELIIQSDTIKSLNSLLDHYVNQSPDTEHPFAVLEYS